MPEFVIQYAELIIKLKHLDNKIKSYKTGRCPQKLRKERAQLIHDIDLAKNFVERVD